jgi:hypothetical protein
MPSTSRMTRLVRRQRRRMGETTLVRPIEIVQLGHDLDTGEAASSDDECQELVAQFRLLFDIRFLENMNHVVAQCHGIRERPKRHCVLDHARHAAKVGVVAECDDQVIVFELELAGTEPGADRLWFRRGPRLRAFVLMLSYCLRRRTSAICRRCPRFCRREVRAISARHLRRVGLGLVAASPAPHHDPCPCHCSAAEGRRRREWRS